MTHPSVVTVVGRISPFPERCIVAILSSFWEDQAVSQWPLLSRRLNYYKEVPGIPQLNI